MGSSLFNMFGPGSRRSSLCEPFERLLMETNRPGISERVLIPGEGVEIE